MPFPGKLALKEEAAEKRAESGDLIYRDKISQIVQQVKTAYFDLVFINQSIRINERNRELIKGLADVAATKYSVGKGLQQDVLKAQVELSKILDELIVLRQKKETAKARINTLLNRTPQAPLADPEDRKPTPFSFTLQELEAKVLASSLPLQASQRLIEGKKADLHYAEKAFFPDFNFAVTYKQREEGANFPGDDWFSAFVTVNIPLYAKRKQQQGVVESQAELARQESAYTEVKNRLLFEVKDSFEEIEKEKEQIRLYEEGFLPQARQSLDSAISGYQVDKVDFLTLVDNQLTLLRFELAYAKTRTDYEKQLARLEAILDERLF
jgi:cobalt-zinc-cadmium efflux system outer membrane protein